MCSYFEGDFGFEFCFLEGLFSDSAVSDGDGVLRDGRDIRIVMQRWRYEDAGKESRRNL